MAFPDKRIIDQIMQVLLKNPGGSPISAISAKVRMNRNLVAKYLNYLAHDGYLEMKIIGSSRIFSPSTRVPVIDLAVQGFDPVIMLDKDLRILNINKPALDLLSERPETVMGKNIQSMSYNHIAGLIANTLPEMSPSVYEKIIGFSTTINGQSRYFNGKTIPVVYPEGMPGTSIILHDITAEKSIQLIQDLEQSRNDSLIEDQSEHVIRFLPDGTIVYLNPAAQRFFRKAPGECPGIVIKSMFLLEDQPTFLRLIKKITREKPDGSCTCRIISPEGKIRSLSWIIRGLFDHDTRIHEFQAVGTDITELQVAQKSIDQFTADQWFLSRKAYEITNHHQTTDLYEAIGRGVKEIYPEAVVAVNSFDANKTSVTTRSFLDDDDRETFSNLLGKDVVGMVMEVPDSAEKTQVIQNLIGGKLVKVPGNIEAMMMGQVSRQICEKIERSLNIGDMYVLGLSTQDTLFGNVCLFLRKGHAIQRNEVLEIYTRLAALALKCQYLEKAKLVPTIPTGIQINSK